MPNPTKYQPDYSFLGGVQGDPALHGTKLDNEFAEIAISLGATIDGLTDLRRSDGKLKNDIVTVESLSRSVRALIAGVSDPGGDEGLFPITDVIGLPAALDELNAALLATTSSIGLPNGIAKLDANGKLALAHRWAPTFAEIASKPTTLAGYGIADTYTKLQTNAQIDAAVAAGGGGGGGGSDTPSQVLEKIKTVDGSSSGLDADLLDGQEGAFYRDAGNMATGTMAIARLPVASISQSPTTFAKADAMQPTRLFAAPTATPDMQSDKLLRAATPFNSTAGNYVANSIEIAAEGSAFNGPRTASLGLTVSAYKEGFGTGSAKAGEIDNIYLVLRQDGPRVNDQDTFGANRSDGCGILIDAAVYPGVGFVGGIEGNTSLLPTSGTGVTKAMAYQIGCMDTTTNSKATGFFASAAKGDHAAGLFVYNAEANGGYFDNLIYCGNDQGQLFGVSRRGEVSLGRHIPGGATISNAMHLVVQTNASLGVLNANKTAQLLNLTQSGDLSAYGNVNGVAINASVSMQAPLISATAMVRIAPSTSIDNSANWIAGTLGVGPGGRLRYCDANGAQPKFVQLSTT